MTDDDKEQPQAGPDQPRWHYLQSNESPEPANSAGASGTSPPKHRPLPPLTLAPIEVKFE